MFYWKINIVYDSPYQLPLTDRQKLIYYRNKHLAEAIILNNINSSKEQVIYGAQAINSHLPSYLDRETEDYDVYSKKPKISAQKMEKELDNYYGGDYYSVQKGNNPGTWKIKSNVTNRTVVDYTYPDRNLKATIREGKRVLSLNDLKKNINKSLKNPNAKFRRDKDKEALQRIRLFEKQGLIKSNKINKFDF